MFIYDEIGKINEMNPLCVLDFYVYEKCQRAGYGKIIYSEMIEREKIEPRKLGYDRPSIKFMNFLRKYYKLADYVPQNNNYVVFKDYFRDNKKKEELNKYQISNYDNRKLNNINSFSNNSNTMKNYSTYNNDFSYKNINDNNNNYNSYEKQYLKDQNDLKNNICPYDKYLKIKEEIKMNNNNPYEKYTPKNEIKNNSYSKTMKAQQIQKEYFSEEPKNDYTFQDSYRNTFKNPYNDPFLYYLNDYKVEKPKSYIDSLFPPIRNYQYQSSSSEYGAFLKK